MRINEIVSTQMHEPPEPTMVQKLFAHPGSERKEQQWVSGLPLGGLIGDGAESKVYTNTKDTAMVIRVERKAKPLADNSYYQYVKAIQPYISSNPYLPRIYIADQFKTDRGVRVAYTIERLNDIWEALENTDPGMVDSFAERIFVKVPELARSSSQGKWNKIVEIISRAIDYNDYSNIKDRKLIEACRLIRDVPGTLDVHAGNLMIRHTSVGPQVVITDPVINFDLV